MGCIYIAPFLVMLFCVLDQKVCGHLERCQANGVKNLEILVASFVVNSLLALGQTLLMVMASLFVFRAQNHGSLFTLVLLIWVVGVSSVATSLMLASVVKRKINAMITSFAVTSSMWLVCSLVWPVQAIHNDWVRSLVRALPLTMPADSARSIMNKGFGWENEQVWMGFLVPSVGIVISLMVSFVMFDARTTGSK